MKTSSSRERSRNGRILIAFGLTIAMIGPVAAAAVPHFPGADAGAVPFPLGGAEEAVMQEATGLVCGVDQVLVESLGVTCPPTDLLEEVWSSFYDGYGWIEDAQAIVVNADGSTIYVAGNGRTGTALSTQDFVTVAYRDDGNELWAARYNGPDNDMEILREIAISPDGRAVFVTGRSNTQDSEIDMVTVAYNATTGEERWVARHNGPGNGADEAVDLAVSPDGARVFVTGYSTDDGTAEDFTTIAYHADTGVESWVARYSGPANDYDAARAITVSPDGARLYVTGDSHGPRLDPTQSPKDALTISYDAGTGAELWFARYEGSAGQRDAGTDVAVSPDGSRVYITGVGHHMGDERGRFLTLAFDATTGDMAWESSAGGNSGSPATNLVLDPDGTRIFIVGRDKLPSASTSNFDFRTVALDADTGSEQWSARFDRAEELDFPKGIVITPDGATVFVTGYSYGGQTSYTSDYATIAYDAASGTELTVEIFDRGNRDASNAIAMSPAGDRVYVTGFAQDTGYGDFGTIAYTWE